VQTAVATEIDSIRRTIIDESPFGDVAVRDVRTLEESGPDDETYLHFMVSARDPDPGSGTWPLDDVLSLRWRVLELANKSDVDLPSIVVDVYPEHDDAEEAPDAEQDAGLAERLDEAAS
jgi:hypothetical protein